ncbi:S-layer homology domain-containing protein, partial [Slackia sp.]|uniref:S-layer homology domain-containing protein n=1 Tax=Slackia sp. TaxID=2049041 RepID=UPI002619E421
DVSESTGHAKEIWWLASTGISAGFDDGTFRPWASVARADMAAFMKRYYDKFAVGNQFKDWIPSDKSMLRFTDVDSSTSHAKEIWWLGAMGISMGFPDSSFGPLDSVARQDMAAFLHRLDVRADRGENASNFTIMGSSNCTVDQMVGYYNDSKAAYPSNVYLSKGAASIADFARIVVEEAEMEGVKAEVVFCQAMKETGWLKFGGSVKPEQCNFAGLGATDSSVSGATFPDVRTGVRAQVQHLKAYASTEPLVNPCVDERFKYVQRGSAPTLTELNGKWAVPGNGYGEGIYSMILTLRQSF